jgi:chromate reductase
MRVLLISGSTRPGSSNSLALRKLHALDHPGLATDLYPGLVDLPAFVPGNDPLLPPVIDLLSRIENADAVVFSTPEYAGGLPGSLKNLLDWTVGGGQLYGKPVAWLDVANPGRGQGARTQLRTVLGYVAPASSKPHACTCRSTAAARNSTSPRQKSGNCQRHRRRSSPPFGRTTMRTQANESAWPAQMRPHRRRARPGGSGRSSRSGT